MGFYNPGESLCSYNTTTEDQDFLVYHGVDDSELAKLSTPDLSSKKVSGYSMRKYGIRLTVFSGEYDAKKGADDFNTYDYLKQWIPTCHSR